MKETYINSTKEGNLNEFFAKRKELNNKFKIPFGGECTGKRANCVYFFHANKIVFSPYVGAEHFGVSPWYDIN